MQQKNRRISIHNIPPLITVLGAVCMILIIMLFLPVQQKTEVVFLPPPFEDLAESGTPEVDAMAGYAEIFQPGMSFSVWICGQPERNEHGLRLYFTNPESNTVWIRLRIYDVSGRIVGETGLLRPGEYMEYVSLESGTDITQSFTLELMSYEPKNYYSAGEVRLTLP